MSGVARDDCKLGAWPVEPGDSHEEFLELCALSATGLLNGHERRRIEGHLRDCSACREAYTQYRALFNLGIASAAVGCAEEPARLANSEWSVDEAETALFARLQREEPAFENDLVRGDSVRVATSEMDPANIQNHPYARRVDVLWRQIWLQYATALVLVLASGVSIYRIGIRKGEEAVASAPHDARAGASSRTNSDVAKTNTSGPAAASTLKASESTEIIALRTQLQRKASDVTHLENKLALLEGSLRASQNNRDLLTEGSDQLRQKLEATYAELAIAQDQIAAIGNQDSQNQARMTALKQQVEDLRSSVEKKDQEISREQDLLDHDRDIRELMGSRQLYIAEVYDVAKTGELKRPFGRVFYTRGKSLIFYAYDLDPQPSLLETSAFQAWGTKGSDHSRAVNLGIFFADSAANKRWVLKSNDPKVLADLDAVFVTIEPREGRDHPSGKHILSAYLHFDPNHP